MNPVPIVHGLAAGVAIAAGLPLARGRVKRNEWYGVKLPEAYVSEENWQVLNRHGGRLLVRWGMLVLFIAACGAALPRREWLAYDWASLAAIMGSLAVAVVLIFRSARRLSPQGVGPGPGSSGRNPARPPPGE